MKDGVQREHLISLSRREGLKCVIHEVSVKTEAKVALTEGLLMQSEGAFREESSLLSRCVEGDFSSLIWEISKGEGTPLKIGHDNAADS